MAGTVQRQESGQAQTGEERLRRFSASLKRKKEREVWDAVREFGARDVIAAYRAQKLEPPADVLLNLLYTEPDALTEEEAGLLQRAYGWEYIKTVYESLGRGEKFREISAWGKIKGWFGRKFGSYKKVNKFENHSFESFGAMEQRKEELKQEEERLKAAGQAMVSEFEQAKAGEEKEAAGIGSGGEGSVQAPASTALEALERLLKKGFGNGENEAGGEAQGQREAAEEAEEQEPGEAPNPPRLQTGFLIRGEGSLSLPGGEENETEGEGAVFQDIGENDMVYREYIILESPRETQFEEGIREYKSESVSLNILNKIKYPLRNTDFTLVEEEATGGRFAVMGRGDASLALGSVIFSIEGMKYTDMDGSFHAEKAGIEINKTEGLALKGGASVSRLQIRKTGLDFMAFDAELERFDWLGEAFTLDNPKFHMEKAGEGWLKSVSMSGLHSAGEGFRLDLTSGAGEQAGAGEASGAAGNTNSWKLFEKETAKEGEPAGKTRWVPEINNGGGTVAIADFLTLSVSGIKADENQLTAGSVSVDVTSLDSVFSASLSAENMAYQFGTGAFTVGGISGSIAVHTGEGSGSLKVENAECRDNAISIESAEGEFELWKRRVSVTASKLKYQKGTGFSFEQLKGSLSGELGDKIFSLKDPAVSLKRPEGAADMEVTASAGLKLGSQETAELSAESISVTLEGGAFKQGAAEKPKIQIADGTAAASADAMIYGAGVFAIQNPSMSLQIGGQEDKAADVSAKAVSYQADTKKLSIQEAAGSLNLKFPSASISLQIENAGYEDGAFSIGTARGAVTAEETDIGVLGQGIKLSKSAGFDFEKISGTYEKDISLIAGLLTLKHPEVTAQKGENTVGFSISAGLEAKSESGNFSADFGEISVSLADGRLQAIHAGESRLHAWSAEFGAGSVDYVPKDRAVAAETLTFKTGNIEALGSAGDFLNNISISLEKLSYSPETGLVYEGFQIDPARLTLLSVGGLEAYADFNEKKVEALGDVQFPEGGTLKKSSDEGENTSGGKKELLETEGENIAGTYGFPGGGEEGKAWPKMDYTAPQLFKFGVSYPVAPGISLGASISMGAGAALSASLAAQKAGEAYVMSGMAGMAGNAWLQAGLEVKAGVSLANITAALLARLGIKLAAGARTELKFSKTEQSLEWKGGSIEYGISGDAAFDIGMKLSAKFLWLKERTLYEKQLGKWTLGKIEFSGKTQWGEWSEENVKKSLKIGGSEPNEGTFQALAPEGAKGEAEGGAAGPSFTGSGGEEEKKLDELLDKKKEREEAEKFLLQTGQVVWGDGTGEAAAEIVRQLQRLSELYDEELFLRESEINILFAKRGEALRKAGIDEVMLLNGKSAMAQIKEAISQMSPKIGEVKKSTAEETDSAPRKKMRIFQKSPEKKAEEELKKQGVSISGQRKIYKKIYKDYYRKYLKEFILWRLQIGINWAEKKREESRRNAQAGKPEEWKQLERQYKEKWRKVNDMEPSPRFKNILSEWDSCQKMKCWKEAMDDSGTANLCSIPEELAKWARALEFDSDAADYLVSEKGEELITSFIGSSEKRREAVKKLKEAGPGDKVKALDNLLGGSATGAETYAAVIEKMMEQRWSDLGEQTAVSEEAWRMAEETLKKAQDERERIAGINDLTKKFLSKGTDNLDPGSFKTALDEIKGRLGEQGEENIRARCKEIKKDCETIQRDFVKMEAALSH